MGSYPRLGSESVSRERWRLRVHLKNWSDDDVDKIEVGSNNTDFEEYVTGRPDFRKRISGWEKSEVSGGCEKDTFRKDRSLTGNSFRWQGSLAMTRQTVYTEGRRVEGIETRRWREYPGYKTKFKIIGWSIIQIPRPFEVSAFIIKILTFSYFFRILLFVVYICRL